MVWVGMIFHLHLHLHPSFTNKDGEPGFVGLFSDFAWIPNRRSLKVCSFFCPRVHLFGMLLTSPTPKKWDLRVVLNTHLRILACIVSHRGMFMVGDVHCSLFSEHVVHGGYTPRFKQTDIPYYWLWPFAPMYTPPLVVDKYNSSWPLPCSSPLRWSALAHDSSCPKPAGVRARIIAMALPAHEEWHRVSLKGNNLFMWQNWEISFLCFRFELWMRQ